MQALPMTPPPHHVPLPPSPHTPPNQIHAQPNSPPNVYSPVIWTPQGGQVTEDEASTPQGPHAIGGPNGHGFGAARKLEF